MTELALKLKALRLQWCFTQQDVANRSGIHAKSISNFENGSRTDSMKVRQLDAIVRSYGMTLGQFFEWQVTSAQRELVEDNDRSHIARTDLRRIA